MNDMIIKRGELYYADLDPVIGSEQGGTRPVLVVQNDNGNKYSGTTIIAPLTSEQKSANLPTHAFIPSKRSCLKKDSWVLLEQIKTIDKCRLKTRIGSLSARDMDRIDRQIAISLGLIKNRREK